MAVKMDPQLSEPLDGRGPGAHLRNAREQAGMSVDAVATALLLKPKTLELLEADAYDRLPAPTFVRGYLRGYARVLGLPSGPVLDMYDRQGFEPPPLTNDVTEPTQAHTSDIPVRLVTYAVAVVLAVLVGLWWHSQEDGGFGIGGDLFDWSPDAGQDPPPPTAEESGPSPNEADEEEASVAMAFDSTDGLPQDDESTGQPRIGEAASGDAIPDEGAAAEAAPAGTEAESAPIVTASLRPDTVSEGGESEPVAVDPGMSATQEPQPETVTGIGSGSAGDEDVPIREGLVAADSADESAGTSLTGAPGLETEGAAPGTRADSPAAAGTARSGLVLEFAHESWVEVYDRERARLFFSLVQPGRVLSFDGPRPFDVLLGYGKDVRVTIDGEAFDHTPYLRYGVARFSIGSESAGGTNVAESGR